MHLYGLIIGICLLLLLNRLPIKSTKFTIGFLFSTFIGARLYHVADYWWYYSKHLIEILYTWNGGLGIYGAIIAGFLYLFFYCHYQKYNILTVLDTITPILPLLQAIGRLGNYFNHEIPTWWLEALANISLFILIKFFPQKPTAKYLIGYGLIRFCFEFTRSDTWTISHIKIAQIISLLLILSGTFLLLKSKQTIVVNQ